MYGSTTVVMAAHGLHRKWQSLTPCQKHPSKPIEKIFGTIDNVIDLNNLAKFGFGKIFPDGGTHIQHIRVRPFFLFFKFIFFNFLRSLMRVQPNRGVIWGAGGPSPPKEKEKRKKRKKRKKGRKERKKELWITSNYYIIKCCFYQFFNSPVVLKNKKMFGPQEKVEMTPLQPKRLNRVWRAIRHSTPFGEGQILF